MAGLKDVRDSLRFLGKIHSKDALNYTGGCLWCDEDIPDCRKANQKLSCSEDCQEHLVGMSGMTRMPSYSEEECCKSFIQNIKDSNIEVTFKRKNDGYTADECYWCNQEIPHWRDEDGMISCSESCQKNLDRMSVAMASCIDFYSFDRNAIPSAFDRCEECENRPENLWTRSCYNCFNYYQYLYNRDVLESKFSTKKGEIR